jgi:hypothetical protein
VESTISTSVTYAVDGTNLILAATSRFADFSIYITQSLSIAISPAMTAGQLWDISIAHSTSNHILTWPAGIKLQSTGLSLADTNTTGYTDFYTLFCRGTNAVTPIFTNLFKLTGKQ